MNMKKFLISLGLVASVTAHAANYKYNSLLSGYNVHVPTNATVGIGNTNTIFTSYQGQVLYSLTNNSINGVTITSSIAGDAFKYVDLVPDANGDIVSNATLVVYCGNTNWIPVVVTNSQGQYYVFNGLTNSIPNQSFPAGNAPWPLSTATQINWMYPATTNYYQQYGVNATNIITISLYRVSIIDIAGGQKLNIGETTPAFTTTVTTSGTTPTNAIIALPCGYLNGARRVYATISAGPLLNASQGALVNALGIIQPQP